MNNVLFISDAFTNGGLETRLEEQILFYKKHNINSYIICNDFNKKYDRLFNEAITGINFYPGVEGRISTLLNQIKTIEDFCWKNKIDYIDCHPFWGATAGIMAANRLGIPISLTQHGQPSFNFISKCDYGMEAIYRIAYIFGLDYIFIVSEALREKVFAQNKKKTFLARNGLDTSKIPMRQNITFAKCGTWALVSRLDDIKGKLILDYLPKLLRTNNIKKLVIIGDGSYTAQLNKFIVDNKLENIVILTGWKPSPIEYINNNIFDGVIGMGRCIIEAASYDYPSIIMGYYGKLTPLCKKNAKYSADRNFANYNINNSEDYNHIFDRIYKNPKKYQISSQIRNLTNSSNIWKEYLYRVQTPVYNNKNNIDLLDDFLSKNNNLLILKDNEKIIRKLREHYAGNKKVLSIINDVERSVKR